MKYLHIVAFLLLAIGGLNWLGIGLMGTNYLEMVVSMDIAKIVYILVGLSALYELATHKQSCNMCGK